MHKIIFNNPTDCDPIIDDLCHELDVVYGKYEGISDAMTKLSLRLTENNSHK
jgi:hypothetical protein